MKYLIQMKNIHKSFGGVVALDGVDFELGDNEVVGLVGDNGAGKSTLIKILSGVFPPDEGEIFIRGKKVERGYSVRKAHKLKIETVHQERALGEMQSMWRNIFAGRQITNRLGFIKIDKAKEETRKIMTEMMRFTGGGVSPDSTVGTLSGGEKQGVTIGRALYFNADLIILDEPTMALSIQETAKVLDFVRAIKREGKSAIYISHNIYLLYPVCERFVLLDRGRVIREFQKSEVSRDKLTEEMVKLAK
ncbi:Xylose import ATP-binding protein XylG [subsurface metagenome]|jgi:simple sugar transport system ATP-binding protein